MTKKIFALVMVVSVLGVYLAGCSKPDDSSNAAAPAAGGAAAGGAPAGGGAAGGGAADAGK